MEKVPKKTFLPLQFPNRYSIICPKKRKGGESIRINVVAKACQKAFELYDQAEQLTPEERLAVWNAAITYHLGKQLLKK